MITSIFYFQYTKRDIADFENNYLQESSFSIPLILYIIIKLFFYSKKVYMIRRVLILSALSALAFVACSSENISSSPTENNKITCDVIVDTDSALVLKIVVPDSGSVINDFSLTNNIIYNIFLWKQIIELEKNTPQSTLDQACIKANANDEEIRKEFKDRNINATVTTVCEENVIENTVTINNYPLGKNPIPLLAAPYVYECDEIQRTGKFPEDDDEE